MNVKRATMALPVYEERPVIRGTLAELFRHVSSELPHYEWEIVAVDDGSKDSSVDEIVAAAHELNLPMRALAHDRNYGLGSALSTIFREARGDVIVTVDADLTYSADHVALLIAAMEMTGAAVVVASPYMVGGVTRGVPRSLEVRSRLANRYLSAMSGGRISTLTGIVRAYDGEFAKTVPPLLGAASANVEVLHEAWRQRREVVEIPAELNWSGQSERRGRHHLFGGTAILESAHVIRQGMRLHHVTQGLASPQPIRSVAPTSLTAPISAIQAPAADRPEGLRAS